MEELLKKAAQLGQEIANHARVQSVAAARMAIGDNAEAQKLLNDHADTVEKIARLRQQQKPIEPEDKRKLAEAEAAMAAHPLFKDLLRTQADYIDLMTQVNRAIETPLVEAAEGAVRGSKK